MKVAIVILNYNSFADCRKCIGFLKRQQEIEQEIIVVDNCSKEEDCNAVGLLCKQQRCTFIANHENRGYSAGNNIGLRYAASKGYEYVLIANPDMEFPQKDYIGKMIRKMKEDESIAICGSDIVTPSGTHQNPMREASYSEELLWPITVLKNRKNSYWFLGDYKKTGYCMKVSGCCFLIRISFLKKIGFLDESTFLYSEEPILAKQVEHAGMHIYYMSEAQAVHHHIKSEKGNSKNRMRLLYRSRSYYLSHYSGYSPFKLLLLSFSRRVQYILGQLIIK
mgnify:CR=1 FL=1